MKIRIACVMIGLCLFMGAQAGDCIPNTTYEVSVVASPKTLVPEGAIDGVFSIGPNGESDKIYFSKGNLQFRSTMYGYEGDVKYTSADNKLHNGQWQFAEEQYQTKGESAGNVNPSSTQKSWMDMFGWGTSSYDSILPYQSSYALNKYCSASSDFTGTYYDWGIYNPITNGGNLPQQWRVLSAAEWAYLLQTRTNASSLRGAATVCSQVGYILLPDNWECPDDITFVASSGYTTNMYSMKQWAKMQAHGAVFLPAGGRRIGGSVSDYGVDGFYWTSSTSGNVAYAQYVSVRNISITCGSSISPNSGLSVRLVKDSSSFVPTGKSGELYFKVEDTSKGTVVVTKTGNSYQLQAIPQNGYAFYKWQDTESTNPIRSICCLAETVEIKALFVEGYSVSFNGESSDTVIYVPDGCSIDNMPILKESTNSVLVGYASTNDALDPDIVFPYTPTQNITLYPVYINKVYDVYTTHTSNDILLSATYANMMDVYIHNGGVLVVSDNEPSPRQFHSIVIKAGGKLVVPNSTTISTKSLIMEGGDVDSYKNYIYAHPQLIVNGSVKIENDSIFYDLLLNKQKQYLLAAPKNVYISEITYADGSPAIYGTDYKIARYDGATRATGQSGWVYLSAGETQILSGVGYTVFAKPLSAIQGGVLKTMDYSRLRFPMYVGAEYTETQMPITVSPYPSLTGKDNDAGWNLVSNPYLADYISDVQGLSVGTNGIGLLTLTQNGEYEWTGSQRYVVTISDDGSTYRSELANKARISSFKPFFVQIGEGDALLMPIENRIQQVPARYKADNEPVEYMTGLVLSKKGSSDKKDYVGILIGDNFSDQYELNADLVKFGKNNDINTYCWQNESALSFVAINAQSAANAIPLGYEVASSAEYVYSVDSTYDNSSIQAVNLYDAQTKQTINLLDGAYEFSALAGSNTQRFVLTVILKSQMPTSIAEKEKDNGVLKKYIQNGSIYIRHAGYIYNVLGIKVNEPTDK